MTLKVGNIPERRWWDVWIAAMVLAAISMVGARLWVTEWTSDLYILVYLTFIAGVAGIALGYSRFSPLLSALISTVYGIFTIGWLFGTTIEVEMTWRDRIFNELGWRLRIAIEQFSAGQTVNDPILFLTIMGVLLWILGSSSAFILIRQGSVWPSLIPLGFTLLVLGHYDQNLSRNTRFLMTFLFFTLLIVGRTTILHYRQKWRQEGIYITTETRMDLSKTLVILAFILLSLAWIIPVTPQQMTQYSEWWQAFTEPWDRLSDQLSDIFVAENAASTTSFGFFGGSMGLGSGSPASEATVFTVEAESEIPAGYRNYWRARSYDNYADGDWSTSPGLPEKRLFPDNFNIQYPDWEGGQTAIYNVTPEVNRAINIYAPGLPIRISRPVEAIIQPLPESQEDLVALIADPELTAGETYQVETQIRIPTESQLRSTSKLYPEWLDRYLQLPADFSPDVAGLAANIAAGHDNPYDIAFAITRYLRINIEYSRTIPPLPAGADPMEWFLFEEKMGFCNYYATAQVLMLRSLGIPARIAVGYAQGNYDEQTRIYTVRKRESHAWPEVYFVDYGWVIFEPTVSQPALILPAGRSPLDDKDPSTQPENIPQMDDAQDLPIGADQAPESGLEDTINQPFFRLDGSRVIWTLFALFIITLLITVLALLKPTTFKINIDPLPVLLEDALRKRGKTVPNWLHKWSQFAQLSAAEKAYRQLGQSIKILGKPLNLAETPTERALTLTALIPAAQQAAHEIISEYHLDKFSNHITNEERAKNAARLVRKLAYQTRFNNFFSFKNTGK